MRTLAKASDPGPVHAGVACGFNQLFDGPLESEPAHHRPQRRLVEHQWDEFMKIPAGETRSYADIAQTLGQPSAARANGANQLAIVIPCHRVIHANGEYGGYGGGLARKAVAH